MAEEQDPAEAGGRREGIVSVTIFTKTVPVGLKHLLGTPDDLEAMATLADETSGLVAIVDLDKPE